MNLIHAQKLLKRDKHMKILALFGVWSHTALAERELLPLGHTVRHHTGQSRIHMALCICLHCY